MRRRTPGATGTSVSGPALGTMMFGAMGNTDHDESVRMVHRALDAGVNLVDTADVHSAGESEEIVGRALKGHSIPTRTIEGGVLPAAQRHGLGVLTYGPLSSGRLSCRADPARGHRVASAPQGFDTTVPANQVRAEAVARLTDLAADAGLPLSHLALAFTRAHPAVTSVLIGPRAPAQPDALPAAAGVELTDDVLDRIDEIVPPGTGISPADNHNAALPAIGDKWARRRWHDHVGGPVGLPAERSRR